MPTFRAPTPVPVIVDLPVSCGLHVVAKERADIVGSGPPAAPAKTRDVRAAEEVRVEQDAGCVTITSPGAWKQYLPFVGGSLTVTVELPAGSDLSGKAGTLFTEGQLGTVDVTL